MTIHKSIAKTLDDIRDLTRKLRADLSDHAPTPANKEMSIPFCESPMNPLLVLTDHQTKEPIWLDPATIVAIKAFEHIDCYGRTRRTRIETQNGNIFIVLEAATDVFLATKRECFKVGDPA